MVQFMKAGGTEIWLKVKVGLCTLTVMCRKVSGKRIRHMVLVFIIIQMAHFIRVIG